jgi:hypothetical protein
MKRPPAARSTRVPTRALTPENTMVGCGSHSSCASSSTNSRCVSRAQAPALRYSLPAAGVVPRARLPAPAVITMSSTSPPTTPPGGCSKYTWQAPPGPSG